MTVRDDLLAAYELIQDEQEWCRGEYSDAQGRHCAAGAVIMISDMEPYWIDVKRAVQAATDALFPDQTITVVNDDYGHRAATMVLRHAILREEGLS